MTRYYFHVFNDTVTHDSEGTECASVSAARNHAEEAVRDLAAESVKTRSHLILHHRIVVKDDADHEVATVTFADVIQVST